MKKNSDNGRLSQSLSGKGSIKQAITLAAAVATLGASLGVVAGEVRAQGRDGKGGISTSRTDVNQIKEVNQAKLYKEGTAFELKDGDTIIISGGKPYIRSKKAGGQVPAQDKKYELKDGSKLTILNGRVMCCD